MSEETVTKETILYVNLKSGVDEAGRGGSPEEPFRTIQYAVDYVNGRIQNNSRTIIALDGNEERSIATGGWTEMRAYREVDRGASRFPLGLLKTAATEERAQFSFIDTILTGMAAEPIELALRSVMELRAPQKSKKKSMREMSQAPFRRGGRG